MSRIGEILNRKLVRQDFREGPREDWAQGPRPALFHFSGAEPVIVDPSVPEEESTAIGGEEAGG